MDNLTSETDFRSKIDALLIQSRAMPQPTYVNILKAVVEYAAKRQQHQENLLATLKSINLAK